MSAVKIMVNHGSYDRSDSDRCFSPNVQSSKEEVKAIDGHWI